MRVCERRGICKRRKTTGEKNSEAGPHECRIRIAQTLRRTQVQAGVNFVYISFVDWTSYSYILVPAKLTYTSNMTETPPCNAQITAGRLEAWNRSTGDARAA